MKTAYFIASNWTLPGKADITNISTLTYSQLWNQSRTKTHLMPFTEAKPTNGTIAKENILQDAMDKLQKETNMDQWVLVTILIGKSNVLCSCSEIDFWCAAAVSAVILGICFCCIRRCFRKRRSKDKKGMKGADLKSINLLGSSYKEQVRMEAAVCGPGSKLSEGFQVQPDMDELTANAEEPDEGDKPEVQKLGKLQFKVDILWVGILSV